MQYGVHPHKRNMQWAGRYIGLPFLDGGRDFKGVDCWGLVRLVLANECGIDVPAYGEISAFDLASIAGMVEAESALEPWHPVNEPCAFDVAVMHRRRDAVHVGVMIDFSRVLHIEKAIDAVALPVSHPSLRFRAIRYFRHADLLTR